MEEQNGKDAAIDLKHVFRKIKTRKRLIIKAMTWAFFISIAIILCVPRYYSCKVRLVPEFENASGVASSLSSIASSFGVDIGQNENADAISPMIYPELFESNDFIVGLMDIQVKNEEGSINTDYYTYMTKHQKKTLYMIPWNWIKRTVKGWFVKKKNNNGGKIDPFMLSELQEGLVQGVKSNINCTIDKQTMIITLNVKDQDRLICATMADSVRERLQDFITNYRTSKARVDMEYYERLTENAKQEYEMAMERYSEFADEHRNTILQVYLSQRDELENDMQMKFNTFNAMKTQLDAAKAKVQERTPAFTIIENAAVPVKPAGPKRMLFVLGMVMLTVFGTVLYILKDGLLRPFKD